MLEKRQESHGDRDFKTKFHVFGKVVLVLYQCIFTLLGAFPWSRVRRGRYIVDWFYNTCEIEEGSIVSYDLVSAYMFI